VILSTPEHTEAIMKRPNSTRSLLTIDFGVPAYWSPDQALAVVELLDGLREFIAERYGMSGLTRSANTTCPIHLTRMPTTRRSEQLEPGRLTMGDLGVPSSLSAGAKEPLSL
jgi:hypothetical protein